jgi:hypothetical protein
MGVDLKKNYNLLFLLFFVFSLLFPALIINKLIFLIIVGIIIYNFKTLRLGTIAPFIVFFVFLFGFVFSFFNVVDRDLSVQFFLSVLVLFLIYPISKYKIDIDRIAKVSGLIMALYTGFSFLMIVVFIGLPFSNMYLTIFNDYSSGSNGLREFAEEGTISFHIGTVPFMYLSFILYVISFVEKKKLSSLIAIIILFVTIFISASRGLILSCIGAIGCIVFFKSKFSTKIVFLAICIPLIMISISYLLTNTNVFSSNEESNSVKIGHMESFFDNINFINFFIGDGLASYYYSKGAQSMKAHTEITPLDMLRYFGFILTPILYTVIIFPVKRINSYLGENFLYVVLFFIYVVNSFTNPTMFNSYGLLIVLWYWYKILDNSNGKNEVPLI